MEKIIQFINKVVQKKGLKQVILMRSDLNLPKGKMAVQAAHASVDAAFEMFKRDKKKLGAWKDQGMKKVVLKVKDDKELLSLIKSAEDEGMVAITITDAGKTVVKPGTMTCGCIGPEPTGQIDKITGHLSVVL